MIKSVKIENYKSIQELEVDVGRFNVIIGENGAGKSNFLEAIALFGAAEADKLDNEFLVSRGIRGCSPNLMTSKFLPPNENTLNITVYMEKSQKIVKLHGKNDYPSKLSVHQIKRLDADAEETDKSFDDFIKKLSNNLSTEEKRKLLPEWIMSFHFSKINNLLLNNFLLYSPENTALRNFYREGQIEPLGINGEGLLKLLKVMQESEPTAFQDVLNCLELFDWFETIDVPKDLSSMEDKVSIKDKYLTTIFDQRSANEGFLFVLFYAALFCSQYTPKIFAIDNIDASFNPKLCTVLIKKLVELAKKYDKQVFVTTHNPAILDGIDLGDEEQKLFVASRNKQGHTRFKTLTLADKPKSSTGEPIRLSEAFLRGYLGGLPKNF